MEVPMDEYNLVVSSKGDSLKMPYTTWIGFIRPFKTRAQREGPTLRPKPQDSTSAMADELLLYPAYLAQGSTYGLDWTDFSRSDLKLAEFIYF